MASFFFQPIKEIKEALGPQAAYDTAVLWEPGFLWIVLDEYKAEVMCSSAVQRKPCTLMYVLDHFKTQEMCDKAVKDDSSFLQFVPVVIGMMMIMKINFLIGAMGIKKRRPRSHK